MRIATLHLLATLAALGRAACPVGGDTSILVNNGTPNGTIELHNNKHHRQSKHHLHPEHHRNPLPNRRLRPRPPRKPSPRRLLLADSFARSGYLTVAPDLFSGSPAPGDINVPGFNTTLFLSQHQPNVTDPIIASTISYHRSSLNVTRIGAAGYCYGGRYAFRFLDSSITPEERVDAAFTAHPSLLENQEILGIQGPVSVAAAENDVMMPPPERRAEIEQLLTRTGREYMVSFYSGTNHGFAVREQRFAKETAFLQAVRWFGELL